MMTASSTEDKEYLVVLPPNKFCIRGLDFLIANAFVSRISEHGMDAVFGPEGILITFNENLTKQQALDIATEVLKEACRHVIAESECLAA